MDWNSFPAAPKKRDLGRELVRLTSRKIWSRNVLDAASASILGNKDGWRDYFPRGTTDAIWFISEVSDASMFRSFAATPAANMRIVILERLRQNAHLKAFVRRVMIYDVLHPVQALKRMQRTARVMIDCLGKIQQQASATVLLLNLSYTLVVFVWLLDREDRLVEPMTAALMRALRL